MRVTISFIIIALMVTMYFAIFKCWVCQDGQSVAVVVVEPEPTHVISGGKAFEIVERY